ncbi:MAG: hypothetical protein HYV24_07925 [Deltaproteobacteria bacterium]|nr:hypothetical protein [Deltaproteobacteria bacterium]
MKRSIAVISAILFLAAAGAAEAEMTTIYGPVYVTKAKKEHGRHEDKTKLTFTAPVPGSGKIVIKNGGDGGKKSRAASAEVELNGVEVADESDFNKNVTELTYDVTLLADNEMEVEVKSCKECEIQITVMGEKVAEPAPVVLPTR